MHLAIKQKVHVGGNHELILPVAISTIAENEPQAPPSARGSEVGRYLDRQSGEHTEGFFMLSLQSIDIIRLPAICL
jgi:hypothetical protein